jgi:hypothetical protein
VAHDETQNLKVPQRLKDGHLVFFFLLLTSYNNVYYKYESIFIIGVRKYCHDKKVLDFCFVMCKIGQCSSLLPFILNLLFQIITYLML